MLKKITTSLLSLLLTVTFYSCYYDYGLTTSDLDVVSTFYDNTYNFSLVHTYFLPDSVVKQSGGTVTSQYDAQLISKVADKLNSLGWTRVYPGGTDSADVTALIGVTSATETVSFYDDWWSYWGWYDGWDYYPYAYGPDWGWYYPDYVVTGTYTTGTIMITITNGDQNGNQQLAVQWIALLNGLLDGDNISGRVNTNIDQAFIQSPYLK